MKGAKQRYWLVLHARPDETVSVEQKHAHFFSSLGGLSEPWGLSDRPTPHPPKFKGNVTAVLTLTKFFGQGIHRAMMSYRFRRMLRDDGVCDDALNIVLNPNVVDTSHLINEVIPVYIKAFDAYLVEYFDEAMIETAAEELKGLLVNPRRYVHRVGLVSFFDEQLCRLAFNLSPAEVMAKVDGKVERAELLHGGVYIVGASAPLSLPDAQAKCRELTAAVRGSSQVPLV